MKERKQRKEERKKESESGKESERTKEALCGEQGIESPSETNKNWNNNKSQKALPPLLFLTQPTPSHQHTHTNTQPLLSSFCFVSNLSEEARKINLSRHSHFLPNKHTQSSRRDKCRDAY